MHISFFNYFILASSLSNPECLVSYPALVSHHCASPKRMLACTMLNNRSRSKTRLLGKSLRTPRAGGPSYVPLSHCQAGGQKETKTLG